MSGAALLDASSSPAGLGNAAPGRVPRAPDRHRPQPFFDAFDARGLYYDCFRHADGRRVLLVGPVPLNLEPQYRAATFKALPSNTTLKVRRHTSLSVMITESEPVAEADTAIEVQLAGEAHVLPIRPNQSALLAGRRLLFTMNRDNDLAWIREWALYHARVHGTDAIVIHDNGSTRYEPADAAATLQSVPGLAYVAVPLWPQGFGRSDPAVRVNPFWAHFLQNAAMSVVLRRYGAQAMGLLNCDIDELARRPDAGSIYEITEKLKHGLAVFDGKWIEAVPTAGRPPTDHSAFRMVSRDAARSASRARKWALDPKRAWVANLGVHPYWHWIAGRPMFGKVTPAGSGYWHFRGINTNWKTARTAPPTGALEMDSDLAAAFAQLDGSR